MPTSTIGRLLFDTGLSTDLADNADTTLFKTPNARYFFFISTAGPPLSIAFQVTTAQGALNFMLKNATTPETDAEFAVAPA